MNLISCRQSTFGPDRHVFFFLLWQKSIQMCLEVQHADMGPQVRTRPSFLNGDRLLLIHQCFCILDFINTRATCHPPDHQTLADDHPVAQTALLMTFPHGPDTTKKNTDWSWCWKLVQHLLLQGSYSHFIFNYYQDVQILKLIWNAAARLLTGVEVTWLCRPLFIGCSLNQG